MSRASSLSASKEFIDSIQIALTPFRWTASERGSTGILADLNHYAEVARMSPLPVFHAGGLNAENVGVATPEGDRLSSG